MPEHGDYDQKIKKWFCNRWIDKKKWLEIHGYPPISAKNESDEADEYDALESS